MVYIEKSAQPSIFLQYCRQKDARFDDMDADVKNKLREALLREQGHLCAYCMRRIRGEGDVKIEHFAARTRENELDYHNLLAVCRGGEGAPPKLQSCDTRKGNRPIFINPLNKTDMKRIYYKSNGEIHSSDTTKYTYQYEDSVGKWHEEHTSPDMDLTKTLNLNYKNGVPLMGRKRALKEFQKHLHPYQDGKGKRTFLEKMRRKYTEKNEEREPYVGILLWYIDKKLKAL